MCWDLFCLYLRCVIWRQEGAWLHVCLHEGIMFSWSAKHLSCPVIEYVHVLIQVWVSVCDKASASGCVWRCHTSPQGILFLVFHAHGQRCSLWDLCRGRRRRRSRKKVGGKKNERGQRAWGQGWAGVQQCSIIKPALEGIVVLGGASVCVRACVLVLRARRVTVSFAGAWLDSLKSTRSEMDWTASPVNPDC